MNPSEYPTGSFCFLRCFQKAPDKPQRLLVRILQQLRDLRYDLFPLFHFFLPCHFVAFSVILLYIPTNLRIFRAAGYETVL